MSFIVTIANSGNDSTECVFGMTENNKPFNLNLDQATVEQQRICVNFLELTEGYSLAEIINSPYDFNDCTYVVPSGVTLPILTINYKDLSTIKKGKINAFANLLISIAE